MIFLTAIDEQLRRDPLGATWTDGSVHRSTRDLVPVSTGVSWPIVTPGCLSDADVIAALDAVYRCCPNSNLDVDEARHRRDRPRSAQEKMGELPNAVCPNRPDLRCAGRPGSRRPPVRRCGKCRLARVFESGQVRWREPVVEVANAGITLAAIASATERIRDRSAVLSVSRWIWRVASAPP
jgi:hypothetical protein